jgi:phage/plasmid primase-like uncharacterized protein
MDLTKYYGEKGLVIDKNFAFALNGNSTDDLIREMNNQGLFVNHLDTTGAVVRVAVRAAPSVRPDKGLEKSGWYVVNELSGKFFATFGNWRTGEQHKWSSINTNELTPIDRHALKKQMDEAVKRANEVKHIRHNEVAAEVQERYKKCQPVISHEYLKNKNVKSYGLKQLNESLIVPVYSPVSGELRSLQYIDKKGQKRFVSASEIKGNIFLIGCDFTTLATQESLVVVEGYSTAATVFESTKIATVCVFSANFTLEAVSNIRKISQARLYIALDNDESGVGERKAKEVASAIPNCFVRIPSARGDYNDLAKEHGLDRVKYEILNLGLGITQHAIRGMIKDPPPKEWLVENLLEKSKPALLAAIGGVGKSMMALDLAIKISQGQGTWFDHPISKGGNCVIISAEDDLVEIHRRINALDPDNKRFDAPYDVYTYTIPDQPRPLTLINDTSAGMGLTEQAQELLAELATIPNLELVVIDPIQAVCGSAKISSDNEAGQMYGQLAASISSKFKTTCLSIHHMSKGALSADDDVMQIRAKIRGASSLVDSTRLCIALWLGEEEEAERICLDNNVDFDRLRVVKGAVVKSNSSEVDTKTKTLFRRNAVLEPYKESSLNFGEF